MAEAKPNRMKSDPITIPALVLKTTTGTKRIKPPAAT
jgi:hypothetical protein